MKARRPGFMTLTELREGDPVIVGRDLAPRPMLYFWLGKDAEPQLEPRYSYKHRHIECGFETVLKPGGTLITQWYDRQADA